MIPYNLNLIYSIGSMDYNYSPKQETQNLQPWYIPSRPTLMVRIRLHEKYQMSEGLTRIV